MADFAAAHESGSGPLRTSKRVAANNRWRPIVAVQMQLIASRKPPFRQRDASDYHEWVGSFAL
ncbi:hypothetical protein GCM10007874_52920 [Labrys miyagiensis]|uniref:Uncharacterized protein n=1 Tax=Labrys miyagiensis TaxID=346912 RepID=A0ABQ6CU72_9HYPH|nr:hypothetical protein GCM10007874_52920 [Labrys miyagiensis]